MEIRTTYKIVQEKRVIRPPGLKQDGMQFTPVEHRTEWLDQSDIDMLIECTALPPGGKAEDYEHMLEIHETLKKLSG